MQLFLLLIFGLISSYSLHAAAVVREADKLITIVGRCVEHPAEQPLRPGQMSMWKPQPRWRQAAGKDYLICNVCPGLTLQKRVMLHVSQEHPGINIFTNGDCLISHDWVGSTKVKIGSVYGFKNHRAIDIEKIDAQGNTVSKHRFEVGLHEEGWIEKLPDNKPTWLTASSKSEDQNLEANGSKIILPNGCGYIEITRTLYVVGSAQPISGPGDYDLGMLGRLEIKHLNHSNATTITAILRAVIDGKYMRPVRYVFSERNYHLEPIVTYEELPPSALYVSKPDADFTRLLEVDRSERSVARPSVERQVLRRLMRGPYEANDLRHGFHEVSRPKDFDRATERYIRYTPDETYREPFYQNPSSGLAIPLEVRQSVVAGLLLRAQENKLLACTISDSTVGRIEVDAQADTSLILRNSLVLALVIRSSGEHCKNIHIRTAGNACIKGLYLMPALNPQTKVHFNARAGEIVANEAQRASLDDYPSYPGFLTDRYKNLVEAGQLTPLDDLYHPRTQQGSY